MRDKILLGVLFAIFLLVALSSVNAEILINQQKTTYNLGEQLSFEVNLGALQEGYLDVNLNCDNLSENIYHSVPETELVGITRELTASYISNLNGACYVSASYNGENKNGQIFEISKEYNLIINDVNLSYFAGESFVIGGSLYNKNNQAVGNAFVEVKVANLTSSALVNNGKFNVNFAIPLTLRAGNYVIEVRAYDKDNSGNELNSAEKSEGLVVKQKPSRVEIAINKQTITPGESLEIVPFVYDFAGDTYPGQVLISIKDSKDDVLVEGYKVANEKFILQTLENFVAGADKIVIQKENLTEEKEFQVSELKKIVAKLNNQTLELVNTGNVPYQGIIQIIIGNESLLKEVNLEVGGNKSFEISAPSGVYDVEIKDDSNVFAKQSMTLTGNAISVREAGEKISDILVHYPIVWIFIVVAIVLFVWVYYKKHEQNKKFGFISGGNSGIKRREFIEKKGGVEIIKPEQRRSQIDSVILQGDVRKAEQLGVLHGMNQQVGVVAIKLKEASEGIAKESVRQALEYGYRLKGVSHQAGDYILLIFSPLLTRKQDNEEAAIKAAREIDSFLREHNRKFRRDVISYGIGVTAGEIINKLEGKVLQFSSMGKTISQAKKIADISDGEILLSKQIHDKTRDSVKAERFANGAMELFTIKRVIDTVQAQKFINEFTRRN